MPTADRDLPVEVRQFPLRSGSRGPPWQFRSGGAHWRLELAVEEEEDEERSAPLVK